MLKTAWVLVVLGVTNLLILIPFFGSVCENNNVKTEFFSTRAAYWCVVTGLILFVISAVGLEIVRVVSLFKR